MIVYRAIVGAIHAPGNNLDGAKIMIKEACEHGYTADNEDEALKEACKELSKKLNLDLYYFANNEIWIDNNPKTTITAQFIALEECENTPLTKEEKKLIKDYVKEHWRVYKDGNISYNFGKDLTLRYALDLKDIYGITIDGDKFKKDGVTVAKRIRHYGKKNRNLECPPLKHTVEFTA
jgi:hypothetical protein